MTEKIEPETLVAYVDGELAPAEARRVEQLLAGDAEARALVASLREGTALLRGAFSEPMQTPIPARVHEAINAAFRAQGESGPEPASRYRGWWPQAAIAATVAALLLGLPAGYFLAQDQFERQIAHHEAQHRADQQAMQSAVHEGLERHVSGVDVEWHNPDSGSRGTVTPVRTFKNIDGQWCREYVSTAQLGQMTETRRAIACRSDDGHWRNRLEILADS